jgi:hypothetical protein
LYLDLYFEVLLGRLSRRGAASIAAYTAVTPIDFSRGEWEDCLS